MATEAETEGNEVRSGLNPSHLSNNRGRHVDVAKSAPTDALHPKELEDEYPVKVRKPYTITKQREKWTEEEHEKFLEALKLYGRSWQQIQEHIGTKSAVQIRSHAQKFFSKLAREPGADNAIKIPPPRPKRKPLHPYPRKHIDSSIVAYLTMEQSKCAPLSSSSASNQGDGSPVSVLYALQSNAFGSSASNPYDGCGSPVLSDGENTVPASVAEQDADEENVPSQVTGGDKPHMELDQDGKDEDLSEEDLSEVVQNTSLKLFGKTVVIPDPRKTCSVVIEGENHEHSLQPSSEDMKASSAGDFAAMAPNGWFLAYNNHFPFYFCGTMDAELAPFHIWWPFYGFPISHSSGSNTNQCLSQMEATDESDTRKSPLAGTSSESDGNSQTSRPNCNGVESHGNRNTHILEPTPSFELRPSTNSAFIRVKPRSRRDQSAKGFVPYKRCKID